MANGKQSSVKRMKMAERSKQQMDLHFPGMAQEYIWHRKSNDGYISIPRTMPIVMQAIDDQSKGQPAGHVLYCLWSRSPDHSLVVIENPATFAAEAGFTGERAVDTWRKRMKKLRELHFIITKPGPSGEFHYVLLINPNVALEWMRSQKLVQDGVYGRFLDRLAEIGASGELEAYYERAKADEAARAAAAEAAKTTAPAAAAA